MSRKYLLLLQVTLKISLTNYQKKSPNCISFYHAERATFSKSQRQAATWRAQFRKNSAQQKVTVFSHLGSIVPK